MVASFRDHEIHLHAPQRGQTQRQQHRFVRNEIRRGDDDATPRQEDRPDDEILKQLRRLIGTGRNHLDGDRAGGLAQREQGRVFQQLARGVEPVFQENALKLPDDRAGDAGHDVVPDARPLVAVAGLDDVLRAGKRHRAVDHRQLAVVAQIEPRERNPPQIGGQNREDAHALLPHRRGQVAEEPPRAHGVGQHAAHDAPRRRPRQRRGHAMAHRIVLEDVEQQMDVVPGGVDLGDQPVDHHVGIGHQRDGVAAHDRQAAAMLGQLDQHVILVAVVGDDA